MDRLSDRFRNTLRDRFRRGREWRVRAAATRGLECRVRVRVSKLDEN